jgi:hypothetical protein
VAAERLADAGDDGDVDAETNADSACFLARFRTRLGDVDAGINADSAPLSARFRARLGDVGTEIEAHSVCLSARFRARLTARSLRRLAFFSTRRAFSSATPTMRSASGVTGTEIS